MQDKYVFFCDESGSTGSDWWNKEQPFLVIGGWLIKRETEDCLRSELISALKKYPGREIKSKRFFRMGRHQEYFSEVFNIFLKFKSYPAFVIAEKKYTICAKIIETFFDPAYNPELKDGYTGDFTLKNQMAQSLYGEDDLLETFSKLIKNGFAPADDWIKMRELIISAFESKKANCISHNVNNLTKHDFGEMNNEFESLTSGSKTMGMMAINMPILMYLLQILENYCIDKEIDIDVIHDEIPTYYNIPLVKLVNPLLFMGDSIKTQIGEFSFNSRLKHMKLDFEDSKAEIFIQLSDILCGFINKVFCKVLRDDELNEWEIKIMELLLIRFNECWALVTMPSLINKLLGCIGTSNITRKSDDIIDMKYIDRRFSMWIKR